MSVAVVLHDLCPRTHNAKKQWGCCWLEYFGNNVCSFICSCEQQMAIRDSIVNICETYCNHLVVKKQQLSVHETSCQMTLQKVCQPLKSFSIALLFEHTAHKHFNWPNSWIGLHLNQCQLSSWTQTKGHVTSLPVVCSRCKWVFSSSSPTASGKSTLLPKTTMGTFWSMSFSRSC